MTARRRWLVLGLPVLLLLVAGVVLLQRGGDGRSGPRASADICEAAEDQATSALMRPFRAETSEALKPSPQLSDELALTWSEEFSSGELDDFLWSNRECWHGSPGFVNDSEAWLPFPATTANLVQGDGAVRLQARKDETADEHGHVMTTAMLTTRERFDSFTHGVLEARMKVPSGRGLWPAFWLMGNGTDEEGWPETGEIDIFEFVNNGTGGTGRMYSSVHWGEVSDGQVTHHAVSKSVEVPWWGDDEFHTFTLHRTSEFLRFFVDGEQVMELLPGEAVPGYPEPVPDGGPLFEDPMHVRLSLEVGGSWAGQGHAPQAYQPGDLIVDYVRAWE